ncbi:uncharacterized protein VTP21DRAFT_8604 [Calcarisporiella thermophila]|uniref:uncharacterized protein n=1 Tax=Calcarisporiella thermophila TaxID=911321 RepID=UPI003743DCBC
MYALLYSKVFKRLYRLVRKKSKQRQSVYPPSDTMDHTSNSTISYEENEDFSLIEGRKYHKIENSPYSLPLDSKESDRMTMQHFILKQLFGNFMAPIKARLQEGIKVLDVGCSSGAWTMDMASEYPNSEFVGVDMLPIFPNSIKPPNCTFVQNNILDGLDFEDNTFDFIFQRATILAYPSDKTQDVYKELFRVLKPGGFIELAEPMFDLFECGPNSTHLLKQFYKVMESKNIDTSILDNLGPNLKSLGLIHIAENKRIGPCGATSELGAAGAEDVLLLIRAAKPSLLKVMQVSDEEFEDLFSKAQQELLSEDYPNGHGKWVFAYGQKPAN